MILMPNKKGDTLLMSWYNALVGISALIFVGCTTLPPVTPSPLPSPTSALSCSAFSSSVQLEELSQQTTGIYEIPTVTNDLEVYAATFDPTARIIAFGEGTSVHFWDTSTQEIIRSLEGNESYVQRLVFSQDATLLAVGGGSPSAAVRLWRVDNSQTAIILDEKFSSVTSLAFSPDGKVLIAGGDGDVVNFWSTESGSLVQSLSGYTSASYSSSGDLLALGRADGVVELVSAIDHNQVHSLTSEYHGRVTNVKFNQDGTMLAVTAGYYLDLWDIASNKLTHTFAGMDWLLDVDFSSDGKFFVFSSRDGYVRVCDMQTGNLFHMISGRANAVDIASDNTVVLMAGGNTSRLRLWPVANR